MPSFGDLTELLAFRAQRQRDQTFFRFQGRDWTFGTTCGQALAFAADLKRRGVRPGHRVVLAAPNGPEFIIAFYGILFAGAAAVPVLPGSGASRLRKLAELCQAAAIIVPPGESSRIAEDMTGTPFAGKIHPIGLDFPSAGGKDLGAAGRNEIALIQYTSGSLGDPKGVIISHSALIANICQMIEGFGIRESDRFVSWLPLHHDMGLILMTMVPLYLGIELGLLPAGVHHLRAWLETVERRRATFTAAPDFAWRMALASIRDPQRIDLMSLRVALNAAEPVRERTVRDFESAFRLNPVMTPAYGLAEATVGVSGWTPGRAIKVIKDGLVSVGKPFPGISVQILRGEEPAALGEQGEIVVRGPANTSGYLGNPEASSRLFWKAEWIRTGDIGTIDEDGDLYIVGREKNIIIQAGQTLSPREIEEIADGIPRVRRSAALGIDRGRLEGEQAYVFAEVRGQQNGAGADLPGLRAEIVRAFLEHFGFRPGRVVLIRPGTIPRTDSGKVRYPRLKDLYLTGELKRTGRLLDPDVAPGMSES